MRVTFSTPCSIKKGCRSMRQFRHSKRLDGVTAPSESGQIGHQCVELIGLRRSAADSGRTVQTRGGASSRAHQADLAIHDRKRRRPRSWSTARPAEMQAREAPLGAAVGPGRRSALDDGSATVEVVMRSRERFLLELVKLGLSDRTLVEQRLSRGDLISRARHVDDGRRHVGLLPWSLRSRMTLGHAPAAGNHIDQRAQNGTMIKKTIHTPSTSRSDSHHGTDRRRSGTARSDSSPKRRHSSQKKLEVHNGNLRSGCLR